MAARQPSSRLNPTSTSQIRRNLFNHHLTRRPTSRASNSTSATTVLESPHDTNSSEIVVRNQNGSYQVDVPSLPVAEDEQMPEEDGKEKEKLEARLVELYRNRTRQSSEPELLGALQSSLRRKVASLQDDNWMFEAEKATVG